MDEDSNAFDAIFAAAIEISSPEERAAYVRDRCGPDEELRGRVEELVDAHFRAGDFLESPLGGAPPKLQPPATANSPFVHLSEGPRSMIGRYKLLEQIGEGGFGVVFMAEQDEPVRRLVALKIIKLGMDTRQVVARFEAERQALALMDHPSVAKVLDGGATETGRPYFVMELVKGVPITEYCDKNNFNIAKRLELFTQVCQAVQHAHQKGLIHRDIKPTNVLVTTQDDRPVVKVIDFGVAKAIQTRLTEKTLFTEFQQLVGTPAYMSPEQAAGSLDIDTRSDVYSLGVLLYELLAGATPFDPKELRSKAFAELQRIIREVEPPTPSTRLSSLHERLPSIAAQRAIEPRKLTALLRGELDWITMKCLEKDRRRRYESAAALAADIMHYLADEPVTARPATRLYRIKKFVRRNKLPVFATAAFIAALIAGITGTTIGPVGQSRQRAIAQTQRGIAETQRAEAQRQEKEAKEQAAIAQAVLKFQLEMLGAADPDRLLGDKVTVLKVMMAAVKELDDGKLKDQPLVEILVRNAIGTTLEHLGRYDEALQIYQVALGIARRDLPADHVALSAVLTNLSGVLIAQAKFSEAETMSREALKIIRKAAPPDDPRMAATLNGLALSLQSQEKHADAEPLLREALEITRRTLPPDDPQVIIGLINLANILSEEGKIDDALSTAKEALQASDQELPKGHPNCANVLSVIALSLQRQKRFADAEPLFRQALETLRKAMPPGHPHILVAASSLSMVLSDQRKFAEAEPFAQEALDGLRKVLPPKHPGIIKASFGLAWILMEQRKLEQAEPLLREGLEICRAIMPAGDPQLASSINSLAKLLQMEGKFGEAELLYRESLDISRKTLPSSHSTFMTTTGKLAALLQQQDKLAETETLYRESLGNMEAAFGPDDPRAAELHLNLGLLLVVLKRPSEAEPELLKAERNLASAKGGPTVELRADNLKALVMLYTAWDTLEPGKGYDAKAKEWRAKLPEKPPASAGTQSSPKSDAPKP